MVVSMLKKVDYTIGSIVLVIAMVVGGYWYLRWDAYNLDLADIQLMQVYRAYAHYVKDNEGLLPASCSSLIDGGYLTPAPDGGSGWIGPPARQGEFIPVYSRNVIRDITVYSFTDKRSIADFEIRDDRVFSRDGDSETLLISPPRSLLRDRSMPYSKDIIERFDSLGDKASATTSSPVALPDNAIRD